MKHCPARRLLAAPLILALSRPAASRPGRNG